MGNRPATTDTAAPSSDTEPGSSTRPPDDDERHGTLPLRAERPADALGDVEAEATDAGDAPGLAPDGWWRRQGRRMWRGLPRTLAAAAAGVLLGLAFPPYGQWWLSVLAVLALVALTYGRRARQAAWTGLVFGTAFFLLLIKWLQVVGVDAWIGLSVIQALFLAGLAACLALVYRMPGWPVWSACLWVAEEWIRDRQPFGGFPWGRLAFANTSSPYTPLARFGGAPLVTFAVALSAGLLGWAALALWR